MEPFSRSPIMDHLALSRACSTNAILTRFVTLTVFFVQGKAWLSPLYTTNTVGER
jgi:hypothetical protein